MISTQQAWDHENIQLSVIFCSSNKKYVETVGLTKYRIEPFETMRTVLIDDEV